MQNLLTIPETAKMLRVKTNTVRVWLSKKAVIPESIIIRLGRRVVIRQDLLEEWISQNCPTVFIPRKFEGGDNSG